MVKLVEVGVDRWGRAERLRGGQVYWWLENIFVLFLIE